MDTQIRSDWVSAYPHVHLSLGVALRWRGILQLTRLLGCAIFILEFAVQGCSLFRGVTFLQGWPPSYNHTDPQCTGVHLTSSYRVVCPPIGLSIIILDYCSSKVILMAKRRRWNKLRPRLFALLYLYCFIWFWISLHHKDQFPVVSTVLLYMTFLRIQIFSEIQPHWTHGL